MSNYNKPTSTCFFSIVSVTMASMQYQEIRTIVRDATGMPDELLPLVEEFGNIRQQERFCDTVLRNLFALQYAPGKEVTMTANEREINLLNLQIDVNGNHTVTVNKLPFEKRFTARTKKKLAMMIWTCLDQRRFCKLCTSPLDTPQSICEECYNSTRERKCRLCECPRGRLIEKNKGLRCHMFSMMGHIGCITGRHCNDDDDKCRLFRRTELAKMWANY